MNPLGYWQGWLAFVGFFVVIGWAAGREIRKQRTCKLKAEVAEHSCWTFNRVDADGKSSTGKLKAVGLDTDGAIRVVEELSYRPPSGF